MNEETTLNSKPLAACKREEDLMYALGQGTASAPQRQLPDSLRREALALVRNHPEEKITTVFLQKNLKIPYPEAAVLKNMLLGAEEA